MCCEHISIILLLHNVPVWAITKLFIGHVNIVNWGRDEIWEGLLVDVVTLEHLIGQKQKEMETDWSSFED